MCNQIPGNKDEIPTPQVALHYLHLQDIACCVREVEENVPIALLIGRDLVEVHYVQEQRIGPRGSPYAQKLGLGWVIIGEACLEGFHRPRDTSVSVFKTSRLINGRPSILPPCPNQFKLKMNSQMESESSETYGLFENSPEVKGLSVEDELFIDLMENELKSCDGHWTAPLPFKSPQERLPNNRGMALKRALILQTNLKKNPEKSKEMFLFMQGILDNGHAEVAPPVKKDEECWYLPLFGVYHPKKKDKV